MGLGIRKLTLPWACSLTPWKVSFPFCENGTIVRGLASQVAGQPKRGHVSRGFS